MNQTNSKTTAEVVNDEIDHEYTDFPVCPHCGYVDEYYWEGDNYPTEDEQTVDDECLECGKKYKLTCNVIRTFSTSKW